LSNIITVPLVSVPDAVRNCSKYMPLVRHSHSTGK